MSNDKKEEISSNLEIYIDLLKDLIDENKNILECEDEIRIEEVINYINNKFITEYIFLEDKCVVLFEELKNYNHDNDKLSSNFKLYSIDFKLSWKDSLL